jgi:hypothetical protein
MPKIAGGGFGHRRTSAGPDNLGNQTRTSASFACAKNTCERQQIPFSGLSRHQSDLTALKIDLAPSKRRDIR